MQEAPKQRGINREIEMPLENQMGTMCRNFFWRETSGKPELFDMLFLKKEKASMNIGEAVRERIIELCRENDISINKLCDGLGISIEDFFHSELFRNLEQEVK